MSESEQLPLFEVEESSFKLEQQEIEPHLKVFRNKSELILFDGEVQIFFEGKPNQAAQQRYERIAQELSAGYLTNQIELCRTNPSLLDFSHLNDQQISNLNKLVEAVTSEVGRALVALTVMQLCIKAIEPSQSIRLHKASRNKKDFSWQEGISMRSLDKKYITPVLRRYELVKLNADGFMMTRSLAENYPYSLVYKAQIKGARQEWIDIVEEVETNILSAKTALRYLLSQLLNRAKEFKELASETIGLLRKFIVENRSLDKNTVKAIILQHINESNYAARLMEISMHSLMQAMQEKGVFQNADLQPLSQMRSANKKHGNIGDIELIENKQIVEAWDAKFGKPYLRDEIEELVDKLESHSFIEAVGFVTSTEPERLEELLPRCQEIQEEFNVSIEIITFTQWAEKQFIRSVEDGRITEQELARSWLIAYTESIAQERKNIAPIDEPCYQWLSELKKILEFYS